MARLPGIDTAFALLQAQTEALAQLPDVVASLTKAVRGLGETDEAQRVDQFLDDSDPAARAALAG